MVYSWIVMLFIIVVCGLAVVVLIHKRKRDLANLILEKETEAFNSKKEFIDNLAHELRTPLTIINGAVEIIKSKKTDSDILPYLHSIKENVQKINIDVNDIINFTKLSNHSTTLNRVKLNPYEFLKDELFKLENVAHIKNINLELDSSLNKKDTILIDRYKIEKVLSNLLTNAIKFSKENSKVILRASINDGSVLKLDVIDFGIGIRQEEQDKIFNRFYHSEKHLNADGIGIGLSYAKGLVELMDGTIDVETTLGKGSVFTVHIPVEIFSNHAIVEKSSIKTVRDVRKDLDYFKLKKWKPNAVNILIVEDNIDLCAYYEEILSSAYNCVYAFNGDGGLKKVRVNQYDFILSDVMMPKMNGYEFRRALLEVNIHKNIPFVFVTAKDIEEDLLKELSLYIEDYLLKPFQQEALLSRVEYYTKHLKSYLKTNSKSRSALLYDVILEKIKEHLADENFNVKRLSQMTSYSQKQLSRVIYDNTGLTPVRLILELRLQRAHDILIKNNTLKIKEVQYSVGINSPSYFNKKFKERFGVSPSFLSEVV